MDSGTIQVFLDESVERFGEDHLFGAVIDAGSNEVKFLSREKFERDFKESLHETTKWRDLSFAEAEDLEVDLSEGHAFLDCPDAPSHYVVL
jgi:hypothetical protein